ncbi:hypothetical protein Nisw_01060 [Candidatus Nitrosopumilus sp. SW]|uniref:hypothetical protein n=1 Tax=Candidatus Nitrosopumilus sp. SW TaxID=2508726 RepID=UPI0011516F96|nr:hypothetical protein [Candidatus Nitrosopumilus sp. SW]QDI88217.1 hypothetical protein Nisw_01060 [Candidatus Nitrosopumilus sp. SW]
MRNVFFIILIISGIVFTSTSFAFAETYSRTTSSSLLVDLGPLDIVAKYDLRFNIITPSEIEAGDVVEITLVPKSSTVTSTVTFDGDKVGTFPADLVLGQEATFGIPGGYGIGLFADSRAHVLPKVSGPAYIVSNDWISLDSMTAKTFRVSVNENIRNYDSITLDINTLLDTEFGANLNVVLFNQKLASDTYRLEPSPNMKVTIPLKKTVFTNLSLDVRDGTCQGCIQVKPTLTDENGNKVHSTSIAISVDGRSSQSGLTTNQWSWNFSPGYGSHQIKAEFYGEKSKSNKAITYIKSSDSQGFTIKKATTLSKQTSSNSLSSGLSCGSGTYEKNGQCVAMGPFDGLIWFFEDLFRQFGSSSKNTIDLDNDGIDDTRDMCNTKPETYNGYKDDDGCPD